MDHRRLSYQNTLSKPLFVAGKNTKGHGKFNQAFITAENAE
jgi:hypothetical protein